MNWADFVNGSFEGLAGIFLFINCWRVLQDKAVAGVSIITTAFFALWGFWNLYYYPSLNQSFSFWCGILVVTANSIWVGLLIKYRKNKPFEYEDGEEDACPICGKDH